MKDQTPVYPKKCYLPFILYPPTMYRNSDGNDFATNNVDLQAEGDDFVLYVGIPFCRVRCKACPYFIQTLHPSDPHNEEDKFVDALIKDIQHWASYPRWREGRLRAVYLGGGTASILKTANLARVVDTIDRNLRLTSDYSFTLEGNARDFDEGKLDYVASSRINRVSLGVQSFDRGILKIVGSPHAAEQSELVIRALQARRLHNIQMDLMYNMPGHSLDIWRADLKKLAELDIPHFTIYLYRVHEDTPQHMLIRQGKVQPVEDPESLTVKAMRQEAISIAGKLNYHMTMVDHFSRPGFENMYNYWSWKIYTDALAIGPGAYSYFDGYRLGTDKDVAKYIESVNRGEFAVSTVTPKMSTRVQQERYVIFTLLYYCVEYKAYRQKFGTEFRSDFAAIIERLGKKQLVRLTDERMELTELGKEWHTNILLEFFAPEYWDDVSALSEPNWSMNVPMVQVSASSRSEWLGH
ncbi:MAG TPA: coproporphyrinogen-III oxidase family protein [Candidatus Angelobacter sp.]|nr:coproporphyrinogen-III oxidase family protein [Candidatus Angelobacter sp.]